MPFRIPGTYTHMSCPDEDPTPERIAAWIAWLEAELAVATAALENTVRDRGPKGKGGEQP